MFISKKMEKILPPIPKCISEVKVEGFWNKILIVCLRWPRPYQQI